LWVQGSKKGKVGRLEMVQWLMKVQGNMLAGDVHGSKGNKGWFG
jgi:hypothetical protein